MHMCVYVCVCVLLYCFTIDINPESRDCKKSMICFFFIIMKTAKEMRGFEFNLKICFIFSIPPFDRMC